MGTKSEKRIQRIIDGEPLLGRDEVIFVRIELCPSGPTFKGSAYMSIHTTARCFFLNVRTLLLPNVCKGARLERSKSSSFLEKVRRAVFLS